MPFKWKTALSVIVIVAALFWGLCVKSSAMADESSFMVPSLEDFHVRPYETTTDWAIKLTGAPDLFWKNLADVFDYTFPNLMYSKDVLRANAQYSEYLVRFDFESTKGENSIEIPPDLFVEMFLIRFEIFHLDIACRYQYLVEGERLQVNGPKKFCVRFQPREINDGAVLTP